MDDQAGERLKLGRTMLGLDIAAFAKRAGVDYMTVWRHEKGERIGQATLRKYALALQCHETWIAEGRGMDPAGKGLDIVEQYLASELGASTPASVKRLLRQVSYPHIGVRRPTIQSIHRVRDQIETNMLLERQQPNAKRGHGDKDA